MSNLLNFLFNTIRARAIDPKNQKFFLPAILSGLSGQNTKGKLLPIEQKSWSIDKISGAEGGVITTNFANNWATYLEKVKKLDMSSQYPIADPANPSPRFSLGDGKTPVVIDGLQNVYVLPKHDITAIPEGYRAKIALQFNHWDGQEGRLNLAKVAISGPYRLAQALCVAENGSKVCNGVASDDFVGTGTVKVDVDGIFVDAVTKISIATSAAHGRSVLVTVESLNVRGADAGTPPAITIDQLTIDAGVSGFLIGMWKDAVTTAIQSSDGQAGIIANLNAALNAPSNREAISATMAKNLASLIDGFIGQAPANLPTAGAAGLNPIDHYLFDRGRYGLNDPNSRMFLPTVLASSKNPSLNPLQVAHVSLPDITALVKFQHNALSNVLVSGIVNVKAPSEKLTFDNDTLQFVGDLGGWNPPPHIPSGTQIPPPPAQANAQFSLTPAGGADPLTGGLRLTIKAAHLAGTCHFSGDVDDQLTVEMKSMTVMIGNLVNDLHIEILADSQFKTFIDQAVNTADVLGRIIAEVNNQLSGHLRDIGSEVTKYLRQAIAGNLR